MSDFLFVLKCLTVTFVLVILMQIKIGPTTIEQRSLAAIHNTFVDENLKAVAHGAVKLTQQGFHGFMGFFDRGTFHLFSDDNRPGSRLKKLEMRRSTAVDEQQAEKDKQKEDQ